MENKTEDNTERDSQKSKEEIMDIFEKDVYWEMGFIDELLSTFENVPLDKLPMTDNFEITFFVGDRFIHFDRSWSGYTIHDCKSFLNIYHLRKIDQNHVCAIYKTEYKDAGETYALIVFERKIRTFESSDKEYWETAGELYYFGNLYSYNDYKDIKVGDKVETMYDIDKTLKYDADLYCTSFNYALDLINNPVLSDEPTGNYFVAFKLLSDGVLTVDYAYDTMTVLAIDFYPYSDGEMPMGVSINTADFLKDFQ